MNEHNPSAEHANPFGYNFAQSPMLTRNNSTSSQPPTGPPLLDNNEHDLLQNFFDNPNNLDPSFLQMPGDYGGAGSVFGEQNLSWAVNSEHHEMPQQNHPGRSDDLSLVPPHNQQATYPFMGVNPYLQGAYPFTADQAHGFDPYRRTSNHEAVALPQTSAQNPPASVSNAFAGQIPGPSRPAGPLKFGSDGTFCKAGYQGPQIEAPDRVFQAAVKYNLDNMKGQAPPDGSIPTQPPQSPSKKRSLQQATSGSEGNMASPPPSQTPVSEVERHSKRRKVQVKTEAEGNNQEADLGEQGGARNRSRPSQHTASPGSTSPTQQHAKSASALAKTPRENLSEEQKRSNHIQSEQKRRNLIKQGFEDLNRMVPELRAGGFSKSNMLMEAAKFMERLQKDNARLKVHLGYSINGT